MLTEETGGKRLGLTHSRAEGEGYEQPNRTFKNLIRHLPNHGEHLFSVVNEVKIRHKVFKEQGKGFR